MVEKVVGGSQGESRSELRKVLRSREAGERGGRDEESTGDLQDLGRGRGGE